VTACSLRIGAEVTPPGLVAHRLSHNTAKMVCPPSTALQTTHQIALTMLYVSFWNLSLSNLPSGSFTNTAISAQEAAARIASARSEAQLLCVSADDLAAPYKRRAYERHAQLCTALASLDVVLSVKDFFASSVCNPLELATLAAGHRLMVVTCSFTFSFVQEPLAKKGQRFHFEVLFDTIAFNLLQVSDDRCAAIESKIEVATASAAPRTKSRRSAYVRASRTHALWEASETYRAERLSAGDMVSTTEAAAIAGASCAAIEAWIAKGRAIGLSEAGRDFRLPRWQFDPSLWDVLEQISTALGVSEGWAILSFLESANGGLGGRTPRAAIEQGDALRVIQLAGAVGL